MSTGNLAFRAPSTFALCFLPTAFEIGGSTGGGFMERKKLLEKESAELQQQADKLADEIKELSGTDSSRIG